jgi:hypothetical protein
VLGAKFPMPVQPIKFVSYVHWYSRCSISHCRLPFPWYAQ